MASLFASLARDSARLIRARASPYFDLAVSARYWWYCVRALKYFDLIYIRTSLSTRVPKVSEMDAYLEESDPVAIEDVLAVELFHVFD